MDKDAALCLEGDGESDGRKKEGVEVSMGDGWKASGGRIRDAKSGSRKGGTLRLRRRGRERRKCEGKRIGMDGDAGGVAVGEGDVEEG